MKDEKLLNGKIQDVSDGTGGFDEVVDLLDVKWAMREQSINCMLFLKQNYRFMLVSGGVRDLQQNKVITIEELYELFNNEN